MKASVDVVVNRPLEEAWEYVSNVENMGQWVEGVSEPKVTSDGDFKVGSTFWSKYAYANRIHEISYEVTYFDPPNYWEAMSTSGPFPLRISIKLVAVNGGVGAYYTIDAGSDSIFTTLMFILLRPFVRVMMKKQLRKELTTLKNVLESPVNRETL